MESNHPLVSVIIPVFNVEQYLYDCLCSVKNQSYKNLDVLLIDDGSTDKSGDICDQFAKYDKRFTVFHTKNQGVSSARNLGIEHAKGSFVIFVDSDDICDPDHVEKLVEIALAYDSDFVFSGLRLLKKNLLQTSASSSLKVKALSVADALKLLFSIHPWENTPVSGGYICTKLFSSKLIRNLRFESSKSLCEDEIFCSFAVMDSRNPICLDSQSYQYRQRKSSICNASFFNYKLLHSRLKIFSHFKKDSLYSQIFSAAICLAIYQSVSQWHKKSVYPIGEQDFIRETNETYFLEAISLLKHNYISYKVFFVLWLLKYCETALKLLLILHNSLRRVKGQRYKDYFE